jgi:hypothetical protein
MCQAGVLRGGEGRVGGERGCPRPGSDRLSRVCSQYSRVFGCKALQAPCNRRRQLRLHRGAPHSSVSVSERPPCAEAPAGGLLGLCGDVALPCGLCMTAFKSPTIHSILVGVKGPPGLAGLLPGLPWTGPRAGCCAMGPAAYSCLCTPALSCSWLLPAPAIGARRPHSLTSPVWAAGSTMAGLLTQDNV